MVGLWQPTPVFLPRESHGWRSLVGYSPQGRKESEMTERLHSLCANILHAPQYLILPIIPSWQISKLRHKILNYLSKIKDLVEWWHSKPSFPDSRIYGLYLLECSVSGDEHRVEWRSSPSSTGRGVVITSLLPFLLLSLPFLPLFLLLSLFIIKSTTWQGANLD